MKHSENIDLLAAALSKAQAVMEGAVRDAANPFFKSKYADLASVWDACRKALTDNGLCIIQTPSADGPKVSVETMLAHSSGQWAQGTLTAETKDASPQTIGSCITYLRRYGLQSIAGVAPEDDDGEAAQGRGEAPAKAKRAAPPPTEKPDLAHIAGPLSGLTDLDIEDISPLAKRAGLAKHGDLKPLLQTIGGVDTLRALDRRWLPDLKAALEAKAKDGAQQDVDAIFPREAARG